MLKNKLNQIIILLFSLSFLSACAKPFHQPTTGNQDVSIQPAHPIEVSVSIPNGHAANLSGDRLIPDPDKTGEPEAKSNSDCLTLSEGTPDAATEIQNIDTQNSIDSDVDNFDAPLVTTEPSDPAAPEATEAKLVQSKLDESLDYCRESQNYWQKGELENALDSLDQAYSLILGVETNDDPKLFQQKEDLRFLISKRILEIYASRNIVVNGNHNAIPLLLNKHVQDEINLFTQQEKNFFIESYKRSGRYRPQIIEALKESGLPEELSWLPLIESGFKVTALSKARALGLWQFIPSTGYKFGLKRDIFTDERLDPIKSTQAAISYLKELHNIFGDWITVLAAYNCGEGRVLRVIRDQNVNYLDNFWDLYERLPQETARYVPRFLATLHIINNPEKYGFSCLVTDDPIEYDTITVSRPMHLKDIASHIQEPEKLLVQLNPELRYKILPNESYQLRVPKGKGETLLVGMDAIPVSSPPERALVYHRVKHGETLSSIAKRYKISIRTIMRANHLNKSNYIVAGKKLKIPLSAAAVASLSGSHSIQQGTADTPIPSAHAVRRGDSLWNIAKRYGTTTKEIQQLNGLTSTRLYIGQKLKIPGSIEEPIDKNKLKTYRVKHGDSPFKISQYNNMSLERFLQINNLSSSSTIYPGQTVFIE